MDLCMERVKLGCSGQNRTVTLENWIFLLPPITVSQQYA